MGIFRAVSSDLSHMGVYTGMGVISVWALLRANTVCLGFAFVFVHKTLSEMAARYQLSEEASDFSSQLWLPLSD